MEGDASRPAGPALWNLHNHHQRMGRGPAKEPPAWSGRFDKADEAVGRRWVWRA